VIETAPPEVVGLPLAKAERILTSAGVAYETRATTPRRFGPGDPRFSSVPRVIHQRPSAAGLLLIAAYPLADPT
jgi:hypothetical protein